RDSIPAGAVVGCKERPEYDDRETVVDVAEQLCHNAHDAAARAGHQEGRKGPVYSGRGREPATRATGHSDGADRRGRLVELPYEQLHRRAGKLRPRDEHDELALFGRGSDFDPPEGSAGPAHQPHETADGSGLLFERAVPTAGGDRARAAGVVEKEIT